MRRLTLITALLLALAGCATAPIGAPGTVPRLENAQRALKQGDYAGAAREFQRLAAKATAPAQRAGYLLQAAEALAKGGQNKAAQKLLQTINAPDLPAAQQGQRQILAGRLAMEQRDAEGALQQLATPVAGLTDPHYLGPYHQLRAEAFAALGNRLETAREYVLREPYLSDPKVIAANQQAIWDALSGLTSQALEALSTAPPDVLSGWMALVDLSKQYQLQPAQVQARLAQWHQAYPNHPAQQSFLDAILQRSRELVTRPQHIALLLPLTGRFAQAADAVRDGVLAAYYAKGGQRTGAIKVYDVSNPNDAQALYSKAVKDGAEFVVGPLSKAGVASLARLSKFPVPTLMLNYTEQPLAVDNLYQFSLDPQDEADQAAQRAWLSGLTRAAIFVPSGDWGSRLAQAFSSRWQQLGGKVVASATYDPQQSDYSDALTSLLNIDESHARARLVERVIGEDVQFTPRRRKDVDFVFLGAFPRQARLIRPQLKFFRAGSLPIYATSSVFSGTTDAALDQDMDGITFCDMPWTLGAPSADMAVRKGEKRGYLSTYNGQFERLVALGVDAYDIIPLLKTLYKFPHERYSGETGMLYVDQYRRVKRDLLWARFRDGLPKLLEAPSAPPPAPMPQPLPPGTTTSAPTAAAGAVPVTATPAATTPSTPAATSSAAPQTGAVTTGAVTTGAPAASAQPAPASGPATSITSTAPAATSP